MSNERQSKPALLCIDLQNLGCKEEHLSLESHGLLDVSDEVKHRFLKRLNETVLPNVERLQEAFRSRGEEVIHTRIQSRTEDGRDRSREHRRLGVHAPPGSELAQFLPGVGPKGDEIVINKTASGVFVATNIEYVLRNLEIRRLVVVGVYTNECVSSAVRSASDLGFDVDLVSDATAALTSDLHQATLAISDRRYARVRTTDDLLDKQGQ